jgi:RecA-family ATPase
VYCCRFYLATGCLPRICLHRTCKYLQPQKQSISASTLIKCLLGENTPKLKKTTRHKISSNVLAPQQKIKTLYDQQNIIIRSYIGTHLDLRSPILKLCKADDNQPHSENPIKNTTSNSRRSMVCEQPYAPQWSKDTLCQRWNSEMNRKIKSPNCKPLQQINRRAVHQRSSDKKTE